MTQRSGASPATAEEAGPQLAHLAIARFARAVRAIGIVVMVIMSIAVFGTMLAAVTADAAARTDQGRDAAPLARTPPELSGAERVVAEGSSIRVPARGGWLVLPADDRPYQLLTHGVRAELYQQYGDSPQTAKGDPRWIPAADPERATILMPTTSESLLWFGPAKAAWTGTLAPAQLAEFDDGVAEGSGPAVLALPDGATSATLSYDGESNFVVSVVAFGVWANPANSIGDSGISRSWTDAADVLWVQYADQGTWRVQLHGLPTPEPTPAVTPTTAAGRQHEHLEAT